MKSILLNTDMAQAILDDRKTTTRRIIKPQPEFAQSYKYKGKKLYEGEERTWCYRNHVSSSSWNEIDWILRYAPYKKGDILYVRETWQEVFETEYDKEAEGYCVNIRDFIKNFDNIPKTNVGLSTECSCSAMKPRNKYYVYKASNIKFTSDKDTLYWQPSIHMPKEAARIFLKVTDVRVERLQDISTDQAVKEGISKIFDYLTKDEYEKWAKNACELRNQSEWGFTNYLWHGRFGKFGMGNKISDKWEYQCSAYKNPIESFSSLWNYTLKLKDWDKYGWDANPWVWVIEFEQCKKPLI